MWMFSSGSRRSDASSHGIAYRVAPPARLSAACGDPTGESSMPLATDSSRPSSKNPVNLICFLLREADSLTGIDDM